MIYELPVIQILIIEGLSNTMNDIVSKMAVIYASSYNYVYFIQINLDLTYLRLFYMQ